MDTKCINTYARPHTYRNEPFTDESLVVMVLRQHPNMPLDWYIKYLVSSYGMPKNDAKTLVKYIGGL